MKKTRCPKPERDAVLSDLSEAASHLYNVGVLTQDNRRLSPLVNKAIAAFLAVELEYRRQTAARRK